MSIDEVNVEMNEVVEEEGVYNLLAGYVDKNGEVHTEFEITEMTGAEEEAIARPEVKSNGGKIVRTIVERCCTRIGPYTRDKLGQTKWRDLVQDLFVGDQDYIMMQIRKESLGEELESGHECPNPNCKNKLLTVLTIDELKVVPFKGERVLDFELSKGYKDKKGVVHRMGKLTFPRGIDREILDPMARKNLGEANTLMLTRCILELGTLNQVTEDIVRGLTKKDRDYLFGLLKDNMFGIDFTLDIMCDSCGTEFKASLNMENFI